VCEPGCLPVINANRTELARQIMTTASELGQLACSVPILFWLLSSFFKRPKVAPLCSSTLAYWLIAKLKAETQKKKGNKKKESKPATKAKSFRLRSFCCASVCKYFQPGKTFTMEMRGFHFVFQRCVLLTTVKINCNIDMASSDLVIDVVWCEKLKRCL